MKTLIALTLLATTILILPARAAAATTYTISQGKHYSKGLHFGFFYASELNFKAKFDSSAAYVFSGSAAVDQGDINKLYGFSDCTSAHHQNSARVGWNYNPATQVVDVWGYAYANKVQKNIYLGSATMNQFEPYQIKIDGDRYLFTFKGKTVSLPRGCSSEKGLGYKNFPYFGGNQLAPHEVKIAIQQ